MTLAGTSHCLKLSGRHRGAVFPLARGLRQVRQPGEQDRHSAKLERAADTAEPDRRGVSLMARWRVDIIRRRAEHLGTVEAADAQEAIKKAAKEFDIPPERQNRIAVEKLSKSKESSRRLL
jgi:hypothetical protein